MNLGGLAMGSTHLDEDDDHGEAALWRAFKETGDAGVREQLFSLYYAFARQVARRRYLDRKSGDIEFADLCQLAYAGLLEAIDRFDPELGVPFKGYASRRISGAVLDGVSKMSEMREQISFRNRVRRERARSLIDQDPDRMSTAEAMDALIEAAVGLALGFMLDDTALLVDGEASTPSTAYDSLAWKELMQRLTLQIAALPPREQTVIRHHYLQGMNFDQIGALLGVTKGRVSQIHKSAIGGLKTRMTRAGDFKLER